MTFDEEQILAEALDDAERAAPSRSETSPKVFPQDCRRAVPVLLGAAWPYYRALLVQRFDVEAAHVEHVIAHRIVRS